MNKRQRKKRIKKLCDRFGLKWKQAVSVQYNIERLDVEQNEKGEVVAHFEVSRQIEPPIEHVTITGVIEV